MVNIVTHIPRFLRQLLFNFLVENINHLDLSGVEADAQKIREYILAHLAAVFQL